MGGFDFLAIQGCQLSFHVGERNGPLGRVMVPSRRLIHELRVLDSAKACLEDLSPERRERLGSMVEAKRGEVPIHVWNAVWMGEEMERYLAARPNPLRAATWRRNDGVMGSVVAVLGTSIDDEADAVALEGALGEVGRAVPAGPLIRTMAIARGAFDDVAAILEPIEIPGCRGEIAVLSRLFEARYLPLQSALAPVGYTARDRLSELDALYRLTAAPLDGGPEALATYHRRHLDPEDPRGTWQGYLAAMRRHARAWQPILAACGRLPGLETS